MAEGRINETSTLHQSKQCGGSTHLPPKCRHWGRLRIFLTSHHHGRTIKDPKKVQHHLKKMRKMLREADYNY